MTTTTDAFVEFVAVTKSFGNGASTVTAVQELSLSMQQGEFLAIVGPSGCGKSTLLHALAGLTHPTTGEVRVHGRPVLAPYTDSGIVFQDAELLPWRTAMQNILLQAEIRKLPQAQARNRANELLGRVGLSGFENHYPDELSGGMQQRVSLCRALLHDPEILVMDEPFSALDALTRDQIQMDLQKLWLHQRKTVVFVTHSIDEAVFMADRVLVFSQRPARVAADLHVRLDRPRHIADRSQPEFTTLVNDIRAEFTHMGIFEEGE